jgi:hypothetical protein
MLCTLYLIYLGKMEYEVFVTCSTHVGGKISVYRICSGNFSGRKDMENLGVENRKKVKLSLCLTN